MIAIAADMTFADFDDTVRVRPSPLRRLTKVTKYLLWMRLAIVSPSQWPILDPASTRGQRTSLLVQMGIRSLRCRPDPYRLRRNF